MYIFKPLIEDGKLEEDMLEEFQGFIYQGRNELLYYEFEISLLVLEFIYAFKNEIFDKKKIKDVDVDYVNTEVT